MPIPGGTAGAHDDAMHQGSAKRDTANGLAGLGATGQLLAPGPHIELTRDVSENIEVIERTSGDIVYRWTRIGINDYECRINCGGVACKMLNDSLLNVANGIAGLDASVLLQAAQLPVHGALKHTDIIRKLVLTAADVTGRSTCGNGSRGRYNTLDFNSSIKESAYFTFFMPDDYAGGSINVTVYGFPSTGAAGTVYFEHTLNAIVGNEADTTALSTMLDWSNVGGTANILKSTSDDLNTPLPVVGDLVGYQLERDATNAGDSYSSDFDVIAIVFAYTANQ